MKDYTTQHICNHNNVKLLISVIEVLNTQFNTSLLSRVKYSGLVVQQHPSHSHRSTYIYKKISKVKAKQLNTF